MATRCLDTKFGEWLAIPSLTVSHISGLRPLVGGDVRSRDPQIDGAISDKSASSPAFSGSGCATKHFRTDGSLRTLPAALEGQMGGGEKLERGGLSADSQQNVQHEQIKPPSVKTDLSLGENCFVLDSGVMWGRLPNLVRPFANSCNLHHPFCIHSVCVCIRERTWTLYWHLAIYTCLGRQSHVHQRQAETKFKWFLSSS